MKHVPKERSVMAQGLRSRVRVRACTSCKSLGQLGFYSLTWIHKMRFPGGEVFSNPKKKERQNTYLLAKTCIPLCYTTINITKFSNQYIKVTCIIL